MAKLIYSAITSLDGYIEDADGGFDWAAPDEEVHAFVNELERPVGNLPLRPPDVRNDGLLGERRRRVITGGAAEIWRAAEKVVYSRNLQAVTAPGPASGAPSNLTRSSNWKESSAADLSIGAPTWPAKP